MFYCVYIQFTTPYRACKKWRFLKFSPVKLILKEPALFHFPFSEKEYEINNYRSLFSLKIYIKLTLGFLVVKLRIISNVSPFVRPSVCPSATFWASSIGVLARLKNVEI